MKSPWLKIFWMGIVVLSCAADLPAQSRKPEQLRPGKLLVAQRDSMDTNFSETVILLVDYNEQGAFGLILNRKTKVSVMEGLPQLRGAEEYVGSVYLGGPVQLNSVMALLHDKVEPFPSKRVFGEVYLVARKVELEAAIKAGARNDDLRLYVGYSGWGPGQLDNEVNRGDWFNFDATEKLVFAADPATVWPTLIEQTDLRTAQASTPAPPKP